MTVKGTITIVVVGVMLLVAKDACTSGGGGDLTKGDNASRAAATVVPAIGKAQEAYDDLVDKAATEFAKGTQGSTAQQACANAPQLCK
jgi:hypothetical protein